LQMTLTVVLINYIQLLQGKFPDFSVKHISHVQIIDFYVFRKLTYLYIYAQV
jgi:hypothetical protein